jgi:5-methylcytosine-specific restriction protein A
MERPSATRRGYGQKWEKARAEYLEQHPWCAYCEEQGKQVPALHVDHKVPHRGDLKLFWRRSNWQGLCRSHHNASKQREERRGHVLGCDEHGVPLDPKVRERWA